MHAKFIAFEGGEGSGKSTQVRMLVERLNKAGFKTLATKEPGSPHLAAAVKVREVIVDPARTKMDALTEFLLLYFNRMLHLTHVVLPALRDGLNVVTDRFSKSTEAYQVVAGGVSAEDHALIHAAVVEREPDFYVLLDIEAELGLARKHKQGELNRFEMKDLEYHSKVNQAFRDFAKADPKRWIVIDATLSPEAIHEMIYQQVKERLIAA